MTSLKMTCLFHLLDVSKICDCKSKQFEWFLYNKNLAVPEYIIEYEYMHKVNEFSLIERLCIRSQIVTDFDSQTVKTFLRPSWTTLTCNRVKTKSITTCSR